MVEREPTVWPHVLPMMSFLLLIEIGGRISDDDSFGMLAVRVVVPLALLVFFWWRGDYPELRFRVTGMTVADAALGTILAAAWIGPFLLFPALRPTIGDSAFDPAMAGQSLIPLVLSLRMLGYAVVTPWMEELFMRSFVMRFADTYADGGDFQDVPIARFTWHSFAVVMVVFLATHLMWEWPVMFVWSLITMLWFYYRKDIFALIVVHAFTNGAILIAAIFFSDSFPAGDGTMLPLWFLV
ncbi:type II CAAX prenyl endopeptidase Rce1 family protein [Rubripirellula obstinata]|nr:CPBP family glutamic-type intramembrane protease [Rubripirellula obstinata]